MKVLLVNKFLYPKGGSETYVFKLGEVLKENGHNVEYFGIENENNTVGNSVSSYAPHMDLTAAAGKNLTAPFRIIYSSQARKKLRRVLENFQPDVVHFNNIQFYLTPSVILETARFAKKSNKKVKIIYTAHDYQLICPSHGLFDSQMNVCEKCLGGNYLNCFRTKCMKNSRAKSLLATADAYFWKISKAYSYIDAIICPSEFLKSKLDTQKRFAQKTVVIRNFIEPKEYEAVEKENYVLEFGHLSKDKGTLTLLEAAKNMPETRFVFAGFGEAVDAIKSVPNAEYVGFRTGSELETLIKKSACSVCPSEIYENCPFSVIESQAYGTPVIGSKMGGIPELIREGESGLLFEAGNASQLEQKLRHMLGSEKIHKHFIENCRSAGFETPKTYYDKLMKVYGD